MMMMNMIHSELKIVLLLTRNQNFNCESLMLQLHKFVLELHHILCNR